MRLIHVGSVASALLDDIVIMFVPVDGIAQPETALLDVGVRHDG